MICRGNFLVPTYFIFETAEKIGFFSFYSNDFQNYGAWIGYAFWTMITVLKKSTKIWILPEIISTDFMRLAMFIWSISIASL